LLRYYNVTNVRKEWMAHAYELLESSLKLFQDEPKLMAMRGDFKTRDGDLQGALADYRKVVQKEAANKTIWDRILEIEFSLVSPWLYEDSYSAMTYYPSTPEFYLYHAYACQWKEQHGEAIRALRNGKELVIDNSSLAANFYSAMGDSYFHLGYIQETFDAMEKAVELTPSDPFVLNNYAYYLAERNMSLDKAASMSGKSNEINPNNASFEDTFAWVCYKQGKYELALQWINRSLNHDAKQAEAMEHKGNILCKLNRSEEALEAWSTAKTLGGSSERLNQKISSRQCAD